ncbi:hypothetical protein DL93DRAFT_2170904 [Clavulina sp. PMI_390]|nr:hypothetical protein DL93DRAFT_2170904 [Clavulina sp. PMI_390]
MLAENDAEKRARRDLVAMLSVIQKCVPELQGISLTESTLKLWGTMMSLMDRSGGTLVRLSKARQALCYGALLNEGLVPRLVGIIVDFAHLEESSSYITGHGQSLRELQHSEGIKMILSASQSTWAFAVMFLARISRQFISPEPIVPLSEWRKYGAQLVAAYRASGLTRPVPGQGEHGALSMIRLSMIDSLGDVLRLQNWEPSKKPNKDDVLIMTDALPLLFDLLATIEKPPTLQISRYLVMTLSIQIHAIVTSLERSSGRDGLPLTEITGYSPEKLIHICLTPIDDSVGMFEERWETLIAVIQMINSLPKDKVITDPTYYTGYITGLLQPLLDTQLLTRLVHLMRDIRDHPELCKRGLMPDGRQNEVSMIDAFVDFLTSVQLKCGLQHHQLLEEIMKTDILFVLEWWSLTAPPSALRESYLNLPKYIQDL